MKPAPLAAIVLAQSGQDVRACQACDQCAELMTQGMDLSFGEILRCAGRDDRRALTCASLWACEPLLDRPTRCPADLDIPAVIQVLRRESVRRGLAPRPAVPEWIL